MNFASVTSILEPFLYSVQQLPNRHALWVNKQYYTYAELYQQAMPVASWIQQRTIARIFIFATRTYVAYTAIIAVLLAGKAYVPLNPNMPASRNCNMINIADSNVLIADATVMAQLHDILVYFNQNKLESKFEILLLNTTVLPLWVHNYSNCNFYLITEDNGNRSAFNPQLYLEHTLGHDDDACLLFTSGTTGLPKGVMLSHRNILSYIQHAITRYQLTATDRVSQLTELTFDFSVQDMFMTWSVGACMYAFPENYFIGMPKYLNDNRITVMTTVPSTARLLHKFNKLTPGIFPYLRQNIFGGEPFADSIAILWQRAAPNTTIDNVCGPTEATIAYFFYSWKPSQTKTAPLRSCIPLGKPFPGQEFLIIDSKQHPVATGTIGELCLSGTQVIAEYWRDPSLTQYKFIMLPENNGVMRRWYRTGDIVYWDDHDGIIFKGRLDDQLQIRGCRVETLEVERVLRNVASTEFAAVLPWPVASDGSVQSIIAFVSNTALNTRDIINKCRDYLPDYMLPQDIYIIENLPLNFNGKVDYLQLKQLCMQLES